jgi:hypothetical protein
MRIPAMTNRMMNSHFSSATEIERSTLAILVVMLFSLSKGAGTPAQRLDKRNTMA